MPKKSIASKKQYKMGPLFHQEHSNKRVFLLSSCSAQVILIASGLWLMQAIPLRAMEPETTHCAVKLGSQKRPERFYKDSKHPQTEEFWRRRGLSERLGTIQPDIIKIQKKITNYKTNSINITPEDLIKYKKIFKCRQSDSSIVQDLQDIKYNNLLLNSDDANKRPGGWSGAEVIVLKCANPQIKIAIKKFKDKDIKVGLEELLYSLVALDINPSPKEIKMARIWDATLSSENSEECLNIIMECANGQDIHDILSIDNFSTDFSSNAIKACAQYLAIFHIRNYEKLNQDINREKYLAYVAKPFNTLLHNPLKEDEDEDEAKPKIASFPLWVKKPLLMFEEQVSEFEQIKSDNALRLLPVEGQEKFIRFAKNSCDQFEENSSEIYRAIKCWGMQEEKSYFLTITHGDAHGNNFFYDGNEHLTHKDNTISKDSFYRVTMIDFASVIKTYGDIGDPAEDVGRFLGSLWDWAAKQDGLLSKYYEKIWGLQEQFIQSYMKKIEKYSIFTKENKKIFERIFKENLNFYKLRFYRIIANAKKDKDSEKDKDIKKKILGYWIRENSELEKEIFWLDSPAQKSIKQNVFREESKDRHWKSICTDQKDIIHWLPDRSKEFIESATEGSEQSYLTYLWSILDDRGTVTVSSKAAIAGMGGIGKTSLVLEYAHEALKNNAYNLIYWIPSGTEFSLFKAYRDLLMEMGVSHQNKTNTEIVELINGYISTKDKYKCLLIYDNVSDPTFLQGNIPDSNKIHILMTSRCNEGWNHPSLNLNVFSVADSIKYFFKITALARAPENERIAGELAKELGYLPLALSHAAHYIKLVGGSNVSGQTFEQYLKDFRANESTTIHFKDNRNLFKEPESEITYKNLIARTLRMSKKYLSQVGEQSIAERTKKLIGYCAYLDSDTLTEEIFPRYETNPQQIREALEILSSLSLIKNVRDTSLFSMHRLVQDVMREELKEKKQHQAIFEEISSTFYDLFIKNISAEEKTNRLENKLPHICVLFEHSKKLNLSREEEHLEWIGRIVHVFNLLYLNESNPYFISLKKGEVLKPPPRILDKLQTEVQMGAMKNISVFDDNPMNSIDTPDWLIELAENSRPIVQYILGQIYYSGIFVIKNYEAAFTWYSKAANQGYAKAQCMLGQLHMLQGNDLSEVTAFEWFEKAADQGNAEAQCMLGTREGERNNYSEALKWLTKAASGGYSPAQFNLGLMCYKGEGRNQDHNEARKWFEQAASGGHLDAQFNLGLMCYKGEGRNQDHNEARKWFEQAASGGHLDAQFNLGLMCYKGEGGRKAYNEARGWFTKVAEDGHLNAQFILGLMCCKGEGGSQDYNEAHKWLIEAANQGHVEAQYRLGLMCKNGEGRIQDYNEAHKWFEEAANQGHLNAQLFLKELQFELGTMSLNGHDYEGAIQWFRRAAIRGHPTASNALACIYAMGLGEREDGGPPKPNN